MPTYEFTCPTCDITQTVRQSIKEKLIPEVCPQCGYQMIRSYQLSGVQFNGKGFYRNEREQ